jgi:peptidoglycan/LPS O-acetylase OafA/YrhL
MPWNANSGAAGKGLKPIYGGWIGAGEGDISKGMKSKDIPLEALRGIAALVVVANHSLDGFLPRYIGLDPAHTEDSLRGSVFYLFVNGGSAVCLFFVLSGYILTRRYCLSGDIGILLKGAVKRWPRLVGPVLVTVLVSYMLFFFHLYHFEEAGSHSGSKWLVAFGGAFHQVIGPDVTSQSIHWQDALLQGAFLTFFRGDWLYDGSLWTMHFELIGSFIAFGAAPILLAARKSSVYLTVALVVLGVALLYYSKIEMAAFPIGVGMAVLLPREHFLSARVAYPAIMLSLFLLAYPMVASGTYAMFGFLSDHGMLATYPQIVGAAILIGVVETFPPIRRLFSGRLSAFVGSLSFPIYLIHALMICSVGSWVYLRFGPIAAIVTAFAASVLASLPLMKFNDWWVARVNSLADRALTNRGAAARIDDTVSARLQHDGIISSLDRFPPYHSTTELPSP